MTPSVADSPDDAATAVLLAVRLKGVAQLADIVDRCRWGAGLADEGAVGDELERLRRLELVTFRDGRVAGWSLTAAGRAEGERLLAQHLDALGARAALSESYEAFLPLNRQFLELCTDWQIRSDQPGNELNDHSDTAYDAAVVERLADLHARACDAVDTMAAAVVRLGEYRPRFTRAMSRVDGGDLDWFTRPIIDSYHTVWFEWHEDLLATLGRSRESESS